MVSKLDPDTAGAELLALWHSSMASDAATVARMLAELQLGCPIYDQLVLETECYT